MLLKAKLFGEKGISLIEIVVGIALFSIIVGLSVPMYRSVYSKNSLDTSVSQLLHNIRLAQSRSVNGEGGIEHGVHIDSSSVPNRYILFKGSEFNASSDANEVFAISNQIKFTDINLEGGGVDIIFNKYSGGTDTYGSLTLLDLSGESLTISINKLGTTDVQ